MYVAPKFQVTDTSEVLDFIKANPFGILVAAQSNIPVASHIPFWLEERGAAYYLFGHLAIANELVKVIDTAEQVLAVFQGPHAYISPSWYEKQNVPTWNYQAVHVYGGATLLTDRELEEHVELLMNSYEGKIPTGRKYTELTEEYRVRELKGIRGFKIRIENVEASYKLSQNRNERDFKNIVHELKATQEPGNISLANEMERTREREE